jgi:hypothetical protein
MALLELFLCIKDEKQEAHGPHHSLESRMPIFPCTCKNMKKQKWFSLLWHHVTLSIHGII